MPGDKHAPRLAMKMEDVYEQVSEEKIPAAKRYLQMELGGACKEGEMHGDDEADF